MLLAWSITEVIRYSYFVFFLSGGPNAVPKLLQWLRYNTFFVLYPTGISSECWLVWRATGPAGEQYGNLAKWGLYAILAIYVPGKSSPLFREVREGGRGEEGRMSLGLEAYLLTALVAGSYILYSHMMAQRRRIIRGKQRARD